MSQPPGNAAHFEIIEQVGEQEVRLLLQGELDMFVADRLSNRLEVVSKAGTPVVLDLSGLDFIDSSGLRVLVDYSSRAANAGCDLRVDQNVSTTVERVIQMMGLGSFLWD